MIDMKIRTSGPLRPVKLFKHGIQSLYSKMKGDMDGFTQAISIQRSMTFPMFWEQKLVTQSRKTFVVSFFISWRMKENHGFLNSSVLFQSVDLFDISSTQSSHLQNSFSARRGNFWITLQVYSDSWRWTAERRQ